MSREYISDVERGKSKLITRKAQALIHKLLINSLSKNIYIPLKMDEHLINELDLLDILNCYEILFNQKENLVSNPEKYLLNLIEIVTIPYSDFRFFVLVEISKQYTILNNIEFAYRYMTTALEIAFQNYNDSSIFNIEMNLKHYRQLAFRLEKGIDIIRFYNQLINNNSILEQASPPFMYYNLALFEKIESDYVSSLTHLEIELDCNQNMMKSDYIDLLILKASLLFKLNRYHEAINIYNKIMIGEFEYLSTSRRIMICNNIMFFIVINNITDELQLLKKTQSYLLNLIQKKPELFEKRHRIYANLGLLYFVKSDKTLSKTYFKKAFAIYSNSYSTINSEYINLLSESFESFIDTVDWNFFLEKVNETNIEELNSNSKEQFLNIITRIFYNDLDRHNPLINSLISYMNQ